MRRSSAASAGLRTDTIQRIASDASTTASSGGGAAAPKKWRRFKERFGISPSGRDEKLPTHRQTSIAEAEPHEYLSSEKGSSIQGSPETASRQLQNLVARIRSLPSGPNHLDVAYKEFFKIKEQCAGLCRSILQDGMIPPRTDPSNATDSPRLNRSPSLDAPRSPPGASHFDQRSSFSGRSLAEVMTGSRAGGGIGDPWLNPVRDWKTYLETLTHAFETHLVEVYKSYERDATDEMIEALFLSKRFRKDAINRMRNASVTKIMSADPQFFPHYEIRFRFCEKVKQELMDIRRLLQAGESGISPSRLILDFPIAPRGDVMLEFANLLPEATGSEPALRFRVSSSLLAETSPIFAIMFGGRQVSQYVHEMEDIASQLPPPAVPYFCEDGSEVKLYRMPQLEVNKLESLEILLHAAHHHSEKLERDVSFEQFVAIAHCCMRYKCTAPLEMIVEHRWLPQWMHKGAEDRPDDLLIISYAFGIRQLFTRMSKVAMLNVIDEEDLQSKPWPRKIREKIWAVRNAKMDQLHACCASTLQEYLRQPARSEPPLIGIHPVSLNEFDRRLSSSAQPTMTISSTPRCPRGSHWCDASNLGWLMLVYNELGLFPHVMKPSAPSLQPSQAQLSSPSRSLAQMIELLRSIPSAPAPVHTGSLCDPALPFRAAVADVYSSMTGLTLFDISGKSHGWALSRNKMSEPQVFHASGLDRMASHDVSHSVVSEFPEEVRLRIFCEIRDLKDLQRAARISRAFYFTYKRHEVRLMKNLLVAGHGRVDAPPSPFDEASPDEGKVLKSESDQLKERGFGQGADIITLRSEEDEDELDDSDSDDSDSISDATIHDDLELALVRDPPPPFRPRDTDPPPPPPPPPPSAPSVDDEGTSDEEPPMTDEEARRILWPEHLEHHIGSMASSSKALHPVPAEVEGLKEKFRTDDVSFREGIEAKVLLDPGDIRGAGKKVGLTKEELLGE